jgi:hypothetical protein
MEIEIEVKVEIEIEIEIDLFWEQLFGCYLIMCKSRWR